MGLAAPPRRRYQPLAGTAVAPTALPVPRSTGLGKNQTGDGWETVKSPAFIYTRTKPRCCAEPGAAPQTDAGKGGNKPKKGNLWYKRAWALPAAALARVINSYRAPAVPTAARAASERRFHDATAGAGGRGW